MSEYEYKLHILCQRSHDKDPDTFKKMMREMVEEHKTIRNDLLREIMEEMPKEKIMGGNQYDKVGRHLSCGQGYEICQCKGFNQAIDQVNTLLERKLSTVKK